MASKKVFSEQTKSKLSELYDDSVENVIAKKAVLNLYDVPITVDRIIDSIKIQPLVTTAKKSAQLDFAMIDHDKINEAKKNILAISKSKETVVIEVIQVEAKSEVTFMHSEMIAVGKNKKFAVPRFSIDLSKETIGAHCGVRINTGYAIKINTVSMGKAVVDGKIVNTSAGSQPDFIIMPIIVSEHDGLIQSFYGRDPEDTGLLTINFTTTKALDTSKPLQVLLNAYTVERPLGMATIHNPESTNDLFKAKDNRSGRWVKNPKIKFIANSFDTTSLPGSLLLTTFDNTKNPSLCYEKQKIKIDKIVTLFTSRKREWCDPNLITYAGIFNPFTGKHSESMVLKSSDVKHNTHGIVFIKNKISVFSVASKFNHDCRILNGAFYNIPSYGEINRDIRKVTSALTNLSIGAKICKSIEAANSSFKIQDLLRVFDYERSIALSDVRLPSKVLDSDEKLFNERPAELNCYSVILYKALKSLAYQCCRDLFTDEQLKTLSLSCSKAVEEQILTNKRPLDQEEDCIEEHEDCKRVKVV